MLFATALVLAAATLHATWNLLIKTSDERDLAAWGLFSAGGLLFFPVLVVVGVPGSAAWPFLVASSVVHVFYVYALTTAYHHGDFSFAYPLARGGGAIVAALGGALFLGDALSAAAWVAVSVVVLGLGSFARRGASLPSFGWAALTSMTIGTYTVIDAAGARRSSGFGYGIALTIGAAIALSVVGVARGRGPAFVATIERSWGRYLVSGACLTAAYSLVLVAVRHAPVGYVATLRESSVVIGAVAGWVLLREQQGIHRVLSSIIVTAGLVALVVVR